MEDKSKAILEDQDDLSNTENDKPKISRVEDETNLTEENLERKLYGTDKKPVMEGTPAGGHNFGKSNNTSSANDRNNPSQNAGNTNAYFDRTEPSEEHPEDSNFTAARQAGQPDYDKAQSTAEADTPKPEKTERGNGENDRPHPQQPYTEGTADDGNEPNIPGPNELPDQQKVGEKEETIKK